ncbi:MAG: iron-containing alcohol dehydrogenase family protein [candidate division KSB1 bacterium]|nr:iron-containing alcohol dehydrogenase family protein [candidate division KSB1 bacterium]
MMPQFRIFKPVPQMIYGAGSVRQTPQVLNPLRRQGHVVFIIDHFFKDDETLFSALSPMDEDLVFFLDTSQEPTTAEVNRLRDRTLAHSDKLPAVVVGVGGGSTLDTAKALAVLLTNPGQAEDYQGWDLVKNPAIYKIGIPTLSGTGAEVSRTAVLTGPTKKQGINSDFTLFDFVILDPTLLQTVPKLQRFFTGMDCYIHCVESLSGNFINEFAAAFASKALDMCASVFLTGGSDADLMVASLMGGYSIVYSEVGLVHALSYGISWAFHIRHGEANCIIFNELEKYYPAYVYEFRRMLDKQQIELKMPQGLSYDAELLGKMADIVLLMERPLSNALGSNWRKKLPKEAIIEFYHTLLEKK